MKIFLSLLFLVVPLCTTFAQITFEPGYIIDYNEQRKEVLIKNIDWEHNPDNFTYKLPDSEKPVKGDLATVKEFGINNGVKYINAEVKIDRSPDELKSLSLDKNPEWSTERLFLKVVTEGEASLLSYSEPNFFRAFFSVNDLEIKQLIFKNYRLSTSAISKNIFYKQQLLNEIRCGSNPVQEISALNYSLTDLENYFIKYHECMGKPFVSFSKRREKKDFFNMRITPGLNYSSFQISRNSYPPHDIMFSQELGYRVGLEAELILPFFKDKWAIVTEPTFQSYRNEKEMGKGIHIINYSTIEFPLGVRHSFYLKENFKLFLNGFYIPDICVKFNSFYKRIYPYQNDSISLKSVGNPSFSFGGGASFNKLSAEVRYYTNRNVFGWEIPFWKSDYSRISFIVGYQLF